MYTPEKGYRRVGRPMHHWPELIMKTIWKTWEGWTFLQDEAEGPFNIYNADHLEVIQQMAEARMF